MGGSPAAFASYNKECLTLLSAEKPNREVLERVRKSWIEPIEAVYHVHRPISDVEAEAFVDLAKGLPIEAKFSDGRVVTLDDDMALPTLAYLLQQGEMTEVVYLPQALQRLGETLKSACQIVGRPGCETYDHYAGLKDTRPRPFNSSEELAIKWSTLHLLPMRSFIPYLNQQDPESQSGLLQNFYDHCRQSALTILRSAFPERDAQFLYAQLSSPLIDASFELLMQLKTGVKLH